MKIHKDMYVSDLPGIGKKTASLFNRLGIFTAYDALNYFPFRYEDYRSQVNIDDLQEGEIVTVCGIVELIANRRSFKTKKIITDCLVQDETGTVRVMWFNQPFLSKNLQPGSKVFLSGKVTRDMLGLVLISPAYEKYIQNHDQLHTSRLIPVYASVSELTQKTIRTVVNYVIQLADEAIDWVPEKIIHEHNLVSLNFALKKIHFPENEIEMQKSIQRLKFDELLLIQLKAEKGRNDRLLSQAIPLEFFQEKIKKFVASLPFALTKTQKVSTWEILQDISHATAMNRLLSGDVGSGKTVVAAVAVYSAYLNNAQVAIMVPTEILARQHFESLRSMLAQYGVRVGLFTRNQRCSTENVKKNVHNEDGEDTHTPVDNDKISKVKMLQKIQNHEVDVVVGTQAFLSEHVEFKNLGLVIVDEQHRFGVEQRKIIKAKGRGVHFLSMTATPIPRSLALMIYGDLDVSVISELPPGRKPVVTRLVEPHKRDKAYQFIRDLVSQGRQVFVVCPLIEQATDTSTTMAKNTVTQSLFSTIEKKTVMDEFKKLSQKIFPSLRVGYLHGKMKSQEKEEIMHKFSVHEIDILVSTSVIEVGVNIPNAAVMMIEGAERFGLAQLHQFRGRVGRSGFQSYCLLFTEVFSAPVQERLHFFEQCLDGFKLAEKDLEIRGPGEVYGTEQSGMMQLRLAKLSDFDLIKKARTAARVLITDILNYPHVFEKLKKWDEAIHLE
jgi:ATP-dependent DNA helicase RecG